MSYGSLAANQWISRTNLQDGVNNNGLLRKTSFSTTSEWVTKSELDSWIWIDTSDPQYAGKASNQWITKNDITLKTCISIGIGSIYLAAITAKFTITLSAVLPVAGSLYFEFCGDNGVTGYCTATFNTTDTYYESGEINTNAVTGSYSSGIFDYTITNSGSGTINQFYFKQSSLVYTTSDTANCYVATGLEFDNGCSSPGSGDFCLNCG